MYRGKVALITGASAGIGKAFAIGLHERGANLVLVARRKDALDGIAQILNSKRAGSVTTLVADLSMRGASGIDSVLEFLKTYEIDILVNNAGRGSFGRFDELSIEGELEMIALNVSAPVQLAHAVIPQMRRRKSGAIVTLSSIAAFQPIPFMATYAATKSFDFLHSVALREELAGTGIRVLTVCPGPTATEFGGVARVPGTLAGGFRDSAEGVVDQSLRALENNSAFVITGARSKLMAFASRVFHTVITTKLTGNVLRKVLLLHEKATIKS